MFMFSNTIFTSMWYITEFISRFKKEARDAMKDKNKFKVKARVEKNYSGYVV